MFSFTTLSPHNVNLFLQSNPRPIDIEKELLGAGETQQLIHKSIFQPLVAHFKIAENPPRKGDFLLDREVCELRQFRTYALQLGFALISVIPTNEGAPHVTVRKEGRQETFLLQDFNE